MPQKEECSFKKKWFKLICVFCSALHIYLCMNPLSLSSSKVEPEMTCWVQEANLGGEFIYI